MELGTLAVSEEVDIRGAGGDMLVYYIWVMGMSPAVAIN
jgi:hypothetical protein